MSDQVAKPRVRVRADGTMQLVAALDAATAAPLPKDAAAAKPVPWRGRRRVSDPREKWVHVRCTTAEHASLVAAAAQAGFDVGPYMRAQALGTPGVRAARRPAVDRIELARLLGLLGNYASNLNQLSRVGNTTGDLPTAAQLEALAGQVAELRQGVMHALGRERS